MAAKSDYQNKMEKDMETNSRPKKKFRMRESIKTTANSEEKGWKAE